jgi:hypothetical protein
LRIANNQPQGRDQNQQGPGASERPRSSGDRAQDS